MLIWHFWPIPIWLFSLHFSFWPMLIWHFWHFLIILRHCALENFVRSSSRKLSRSFLDISGRKRELSSSERSDGRIWLLLIQNLLCIQSIACRRNPNFHNHSVLSKLLQSISTTALFRRKTLLLLLLVLLILFVITIFIIIITVVEKCLEMSHLQWSTSVSSKYLTN